jgi:hypothetical protein
MLYPKNTYDIDPSNGLVIFIIGIMLCLYVLFQNIKSTNLIHGIIITSLQSCYLPILIWTFFRNATAENRTVVVDGKKYNVKIH